MNVEMLEQSGNIIFKAIAGSRAYGTNTPTSDIDIRGVFRLPISDVITMLDIPQEVSNDSQDIKFYELKKFIKLAADCNPSIIELCYLPEDCIQVTSPMWRVLIDHRNLFISKKAFHTFSGYAFSMLEKAKSQNRYVNNPKPETPPVKEDFCWLLSNYEFSGDKYDSKGYVLGMPFRPEPLKQKTGIDLRLFNCSAAEHLENTYRLYYYGDQAKGVFRGDGMLVPESIPIEDEQEKFWGLLIYNKQAFEKELNVWKSYWEWRKNRNEARWVDQEKGLRNYDCYLDSETEFLTNNGWKRFGDILDGDLIGTTSRDENLIFEKPNSKFSCRYSGDIYTYENKYTRFSVTPNHRLYVSDIHRKLSNNFSTQYSKKQSNWHFESVESYMKGRKSHKHILATLCNKRKDNILYSDDLLRLAGLYISEGSICFYNNKPLAIYISQLEGGKIEPVINSVKDYDVKRTSHFRKNRNEITYRIQDSVLAGMFLEWFGHGCFIKRLPYWVYTLSTRQVKIFMDSLISGDGHRHSKGHVVYYTSSRGLAVDLQTLLFSNGFVSQIYTVDSFRYDDKLGFKRKHRYMYQLFISKLNIHVATMSKRKNGYADTVNSGWSLRLVKNAKIVCFDLPSGIIITRNKNKISVQGNSKNASHCVRLILSGKHILQYGEPIVRFEGTQLNYLKDIKEGLIPYDVLMADIEKQMAEMENVCNSSSLPWGADMKAVNRLYKQLMGV